MYRPNDAPNSLTSSEKKRLRDRKAQKTLREKRDAHVKSLEDRVAFCERHHGHAQAQRLLATVESLSRENERLRVRQERLKGVVTEWEVEDAHGHHDAGLALNRQGSSDDAMLSLGYNMASASASTTASASTSPLASTGHKQHTIDTKTSVSTPLQNLGPDLPPWYQTPINNYGHNLFYFPATCPWLSNPHLIALCPPYPSPLDLLHGTRRNYLANQIHHLIRRRAFRDSECLALGWLAYLFSKWRATPSPETFARLAPFQRPVAIQLQKGHPAALDLMPWPQLRTNLIKNWTKFDFVEFAGYASCCIKVRWPWGEDVLERDEEDRFQVRLEFMEVFMRESGWGLTTEFIQRYPEFVEGMDVENVRFRFELPDLETLSFQKSEI
ncbi:bZIP transcription factor [Aspergillus ruber CBS 135680]|uniref:BZIP transcription factor n=1 Tax=Aspergillus ruber (strain CBS 135680) TaxID=1388766 RepID=A0A017S5S9_ASPRC|nr:uncharacterized protein EURHEDRAFT_517603 [Aspergillus ruber CBS 135680]EYE92317.1 hypothetical protein EURHEDRAFT_517603 [Aspergillus ruber CBS 135680]